MYGGVYAIGDIAFCLGFAVGTEPINRVADPDSLRNSFVYLGSVLYDWYYTFKLGYWLWLSCLVANSNSWHLDPDPQICICWIDGYSLLAQELLESKVLILTFAGVFFSLSFDGRVILFYSRTWCPLDHTLSHPVKMSSLYCEIILKNVNKIKPHKY